MSSSTMRWDRASARSSSDWRRYSSGSDASSATALGCFSAPPGSRSESRFTASRAASAIDARSNTAVTPCTRYPVLPHGLFTKSRPMTDRGFSAKLQRAFRSGAFFRLERVSSSAVDSTRNCGVRVYASEVCIRNGTGRFSTPTPGTAWRLPLPAGAGDAAAAAGTHASRTRFTRTATSSACASPPTLHVFPFMASLTSCKVVGTMMGIPSVPRLCLIASWDRW
mmetsp:Transcript_5980/g.24259  ORF Transcript_5980/g.24259 Transcript_5980/m.24259 type:complete len:224 (+) Transcript_5980:534-1205(+)